jgi:hypothetical protein
MILNTLVWLAESAAKDTAKPRARKRSEPVDVPSEWAWVSDLKVGDVVVLREPGKVTIIGRHWVN